MQTPKPPQHTWEEYVSAQKRLNSMYAQLDGRTAEGKRLKQKIINKTMQLVGEWKQLLK
jgi:hypothetical protein